MKESLLLTLLLLLPFGSYAKQVSINEAKQKAVSFYNQGTNISPKKAKAIASELNLSYTLTDDFQAPLLYVLDSPYGNGFILVSAEDSSSPILGYSDSGKFDFNNIPSSLRYLLNEYADEIKYLRDSNIECAPRNSNIGHSVAPLLNDIAWDQGQPYNDDCPIYSKGIHCATGCAATAMAQILYFHRWPITGKGEHSYTAPILGKVLSADFSKSNYQWNAMLPKYDSASSPESCAAVAKLMSDCGIAIDMDYWKESGALSIKWCNALINYFDYDIAVAYRSRNNYGIQEWESIIRNEIDNNRPVYVTGFTDQGGHAFVFDGYDKNGYIHINWGWSGMSNGYFLSTALTPATQGIGGSNGGFNYRQIIITGIQKPKTDSEKDIELVSAEALKASVSRMSKDSQCDISINGKITNVGWQDAVCTFGLLVYDEQFNLVKVIEGENNVSIPLSTDKIGTSFSNVSFSDIPEGTYKVFLGARNNNGKAWNRVRDSYIGLPNYLVLRINESDISFASADSHILSASNITINHELFVNKTGSVSATITNSGDSEYYGEVKAALYNKTSKKKVAEGAGYIIDIVPGESCSIEFNDSYNVDAGDYYLAIIDEDMMKLNSFISVNIKDVSNENAIINAAEQLSFADNDNVPMDNITLSAKLKCTQGMFTGQVFVYIFDEKGANTIGCLNPTIAYINTDETQEITFSGFLENGVPGTTYKASLVDGTNFTYIEPKDLASCLFTLSSASGIGTPFDDNEIAISPNPASDIINVTGSQINRISIISPNGTMVFDKHFDCVSNASINIDYLNPQLYIIKIQNESTTKNLRFIKK